MRNNLEVTYDRLMDDSTVELLRINTTEDIEPCNSLIGQERADRSMRFGTSIEERGYNIYISGQRGTGRLNYCKKFLNEISRELNVPDDWCYVYNFKEEKEPIALRFQRGMGRIFKQDMEFMIKKLIVKIPEAFSNEEYQRQKGEILEDYQNIKSSLLDELSRCAESLSLQVKATGTGFAFIPVQDGRPLSEVEYDAIEGDVKDTILKNISAMRIKALEILRRLKEHEKKAEQKIYVLDTKIGTLVVENQISKLRKKYGENSKALAFLEDVKEDILKNLSVFMNEIDAHKLNSEQEEILMKYKVNLLVDNSELKGAPVIYEVNPNYSNLIGSIEYESKLGTMTTDFLMIRAGSILKANGGYLILNAKDVLKNY